MTRLDLRSVDQRLTSLSPERRTLVQQRLTRRGYPLPPVPFGIWLFEQLHPGTSAYHNPAGVRVRGPLQPAALYRTLVAIQRRHAPLRSRYVEGDDGVRAVVDDEAPLAAAGLDLRALRADRRWAAADKAIAAAAQHPFNLETGPVWRTLLVRLADDDAILLCTLHHIVSDGWSLRVLARDLDAGYAAALGGDLPRLPSLACSYFDLVGQLAGPSEAPAEWVDRLAALRIELPLPYDAAPNGDGTRGSTVGALVDLPTTSRLSARCRLAQVSLTAGLLAAFALVVASVSGERRMVITMPAANREDARTHDMIGCLLNTTCLPFEIGDEGRPLRSLLSVAAQALREAIQHAEVPYGALAAALARRHCTPGSAVSNVMFVQNNAPSAGAMGAMRLDRHPVPVAAVKHDLALIVHESASGVHAELEYRSDRFTRATATEWSRRFEHAAELLATAEDRVTVGQVLDLVVRPTGHGQG